MNSIENTERDYYESFSFGDSPEMADELLALVLAGKKTATVSVVVDGFTGDVENEVLTQVATELQTLVDEAFTEERENPMILITEGWARVLEYDRFKKVLDIGAPAMKPLYFVLYKSPNRVEYEYLCL